MCIDWLPKKSIVVMAIQCTMMLLDALSTISTAFLLFKMTFSIDCRIVCSMWKRTLDAIMIKITCLHQFPKATASNPDRYLGLCIQTNISRISLLFKGSKKRTAMEPWIMVFLEIPVFKHFREGNWNLPWDSDLWVESVLLPNGSSSLKDGTTWWVLVSWTMNCEI